MANGLSVMNILIDMAMGPENDMNYHVNMLLMNGSILAELSLLSLLVMARVK